MLQREDETPAIAAQKLHGALQQTFDVAFCEAERWLGPVLDLVPTKDDRQHRHQECGAVQVGVLYRA